MTDDAKMAVGEVGISQAQVELAEELFRLAEQVAASPDGASLAEQRRKEWARQRLRRAIDTGVKVESQASHSTNHVWIVDVLSDVADYAQHNQLQLLHEYLRDTQFLVLELLNLQEFGRAPKDEVQDNDV